MYKFGTVPRRIAALLTTIVAATCALSAVIELTDERLFVLALLVAIAGTWLAHRRGLLATAELAAKEEPHLLRAALLVSAAVLIVVLRDDTFGLLMLATV